MLIVKKVYRTCTACPAQWEGILEDGQAIYVRYRWGFLSVRVPGVEGQEVFGETLGDFLHGFMTYETLKEKTAGLIQWPEEERWERPEEEAQTS